jgi:hypothetical protein
MYVHVQYFGHDPWEIFRVRVVVSDVSVHEKSDFELLDLTITSHYLTPLVSHWNDSSSTLLTLKDVHPR